MHNICLVSRSSTFCLGTKLSPKAYSNFFPMSGQLMRMLAAAVQHNHCFMRMCALMTSSTSSSCEATTGALCSIWRFTERLS